MKIIAIIISFFQTVEHYVSALENQHKHKIPFSIQIAQSMLESGMGKSELAKKSNNCFGILAFSNWKGKVLKVNDKLSFRKYDSIKESYDDHAEFLSIYYKFAIGKDWKYWITYCKGYAAHNDYWKVLGEIIEDQKLYLFDRL